MGSTVITVLIVDDHRMVAEGLAAALTAAGGIDVVGISATASDGVARVAVFRPDVVLMDFGLPDEDGATATERLKAYVPQAKVVMVTSSSDEHVLARAIEAGCSGFLTKDRPAAEVVDAVRAAAEGEALISSGLLARLLPRLRRAPEGRGSDLTPREREVLGLMAEGLGTAAIAERLTLSINTVRGHAQSILTKLGVHSKLEAVAVATREGILRSG